MEKKNKGDYLILQEKLRKLEEQLFDTKERLKFYGYKDSSENSDWTALDEKLKKCQSEISLLKAKMAWVSQEGNETITYKILETGKEKTIQLTSGESNPDQGKISRVSPLGAALNKKKVGEIAEVKINQIKFQIQIIAIK